MNKKSPILHRICNNWDYIVLILLMGVYSVLFSELAILRHNSFASGFDLANVNQTSWNTLYGNFFSLSYNGNTVSRLSIHADLILVLLSPIYLLWNNVRVLLVTASVFLAIGSIPVYLLSRKLLHNKIISLVLVLIYLLNPAMEWTNIYDFHAVSLAIPFLLFAFYFAYIKKWSCFFVTAFLALITKEEISLSVALMGLYIFFVPKERKVGLITFIFSSLWFYLMIFVVIPHFSADGRHWAFSWYQFHNDQTGNSELVPSFSQLIHTFLFDKGVQEYYVSLLKPFAFFPLIGLPYLIFSLPEVAINVLSSHAQMRSTMFHYDSGITPWLIIATIFSIYFIKKILEKIPAIKKYEKLMLYGVTLYIFVIALRVNYHYSPLPSTPSCWCIMYDVTQEDFEFNKLLRTIPRSASVTSSPEIRPHVTRRLYSYTLPDATNTADYIAIIDQNRMVGDYNPKVFELKLRDKLNAGKHYTLVKHIGHFYLYQRNGYKKG